MHSKSVAIVMVAFWAGALEAGTRHVPGDYPTIQSAIDAAVPGDTVLVEPGTYVEHIDFQGKGITVTSSGGASATTIDGARAPAIVSFKSGEGADAVLSGFTITNGYLGSGAGIYCTASPQILNNVITGNFTGPNGVGGGIYSKGGAPTIRGNTITSNGAGNEGGGIYSEGAALIEGNTLRKNGSRAGGAIAGSGGIVRGNTITDNVAVATVGFGAGGGLGCRRTLIENNVITGNSAGLGAGINCDDCVVSNNIIDSNHSTIGGGVDCRGSASGAIIRHNQITNNTSTSVSGISGHGGGIAAGGTVTIDGNLIMGNTCDGGNGAGLSVSGYPLVMNNLIIGNQARPDSHTLGGNGGGLYVSGDYASDAVYLLNDTFSGNTAVLAGGAVAIDQPMDPVRITNNILWGDSAPSGPEIALISTGQVVVTFSDVQGGSVGTGNLDTDPLFDPTRLWHILGCSPCRDAGNTSAPSLPSSDFDDDARVAYGAVDIGADEWVECMSFMVLGTGLTGSGGFVPLLSGVDGGCQPGGNGNCGAGQYSMSISQGLGGAPGYLWASLSTTDFFPFYGGHFYIGFATPWLLTPVTLNGTPGQAGAGSLQFTSVDLSAYSPLDLYLQGTFLDSGAVQGVSLTNSLRLRVTK